MSESATRRMSTRLALIAAATKVIAAKGVDVSVEEISSAAGFTRGAFYSNFASKTDLYIAIIEHHSSSSLAALRNAIPDDIEAVKDFDDLVTTVERLIPFEDNDPEIVLALHSIHLAAIRQPELRKTVARLYEEDSAAALKVLTMLLEKLGIRLRIPVDSALTLLRAVYLSALTDAPILQDDSSELLRRQLTTALRAIVINFE